MPDQIPVLIVGAGPVGLTAAAFLTHYGVPVRIIDKKLEATQTSNAVAIHARTMELLEIIGLSESLLSVGHLVKASHVYSNRKKVASLDFSNIESRYPFVCCVPQCETERLLIEHLEHQGVEVERGITIEHRLSDAEQGITLSSSHGDIQAQWVLACDGYHSVLRDDCHVPYVGEDLKFKFIMIDAPLEWDHPLDPMSIALGATCTLALFPMQHSVRLLAEVSRSSDFKEAEPTQATFSAIVERYLPGKMLIKEPLWASQFWIHERLAEQYRDHRVFFAGDAAHVHSPLGGQGMNTGIQDVINLCWKLAYVIKQQASEDVLNSYQEERRPVAQAVLSATTRLSKIAFSHSAIIRGLRNVVLSCVTRLPAVQRKITAAMSQTVYRYCNSSIVAEGRLAHLQAGSRFPYWTPSEWQHGLIDYVGNAKEMFKDDDRLTVIPADSLELPKALVHLSNQYCLVRPDGYIGCVSHDIGRIRAYLDQL
ncbi:MAG: hypothetical protein CMF55_07110 [Legionellales bacterium]|nr:hypothetical protein [Legionellales bacterium]